MSGGPVAHGGVAAAEAAFGGLVVQGEDRGASAGRGCECGEWGCWPLMARSTATADTVTWGAFE